MPFFGGKVILEGYQQKTQDKHISINFLWENSAEI